jgi:hypothetical protein
MRSKKNEYFLLSLVFSILLVADVAAGVKNIPLEEACAMLNSVGLATSDWQTYYDNACGCSSRAKPLGAANPFKNLMSYYVEGVGQAVSQLRLIVSVLNPEEAENAYAEFQKTALFLIRQLTLKPVPESFYRAIANGTNQTFLVDGFLFEIIQKKWTMNSDWGSLACSDIRLVIH